MDRQELEALVSEAYKRSPLSVDLVVSAFLQALHSHRRPSVCTPFPTSLFSKHGEKDFAAAEAAVQHFSDIQLDFSGMEAGPLHKPVDNIKMFATLPVEPLKLLQWLLRFQYNVQLVVDPALELPKEISDKLYGSHGFITARSRLLPDYILKLQESDTRACAAFEASKSQFGSIFAFHGTSAENLHSILRCGLLILSNSSLQRNGAIFGEGIYLSTDLAVALGFCKPGTGWERSFFGQRARFLLLCEVAKGNQVLCSDTSNPGASLKKHDKDLGTYIIVQNCDLVKLRFLFVYVEPSGGRAAAQDVKEELHPVQASRPDSPTLSMVRRVNWCKMMVVLYAMLLLGIAYLNSPSASKFATKMPRK